MFFALALGTVGCGGSGGDPVSIPTGNNGGGGQSDDQRGGTITLSGHYILIGTLNTESELHSYIDKIITDRLSVSDIENVSDPFSVNFSSRDIIFIADARNLSSDNLTTNAFLYNTLGLSGATIAAVYPNAEDVNTLGSILGIQFVSPNDEPNDKHFEILAVGTRYIDSDDTDFLTYDNGDITYNFVYVERSDKNEDYDDIGTASPDVYDPDPTYSDDVSIALISADIIEAYENRKASEPAYTEAERVVDEAEQARIREELEKEYQTSRVNELIAWSEGLDDAAREIADEVIRSASSFAVNVAANEGMKTDDVMKLVSGTQTKYSHNFYETFMDYDDRVNAGGFERRVSAGSWSTFADKCDFDNKRLRRKFWKDFRISRYTTANHTTYSFHSFQTHSDYYIIHSSVTTQPDQLQVRAKFGSNANGGEVEGAGAYNYAVVLGCTRSLSLRIWPHTDSNVERIKIMPNLTVNREHSYSDTDGWNIGGGTSFNAGGGKGSQTGDGLFGGTGKSSEFNVGGSLSFNWGMTHQTTRQWSAADYELIPKLYDMSGNNVSVAGWEIEVLPPHYKSKQGWTEFQTAGRSAVTMDTESIWRVPADSAKTNAFIARIDWKNGFMWAHDFEGALGAKRYDCTVEHDGNNSSINFDRPSWATMSDVVTNGTREGKMYTAKIFTEGSWTASSNASWLVPLQASGERATNGENFSYTVEPNNTGASRRETITITSGQDTIYLVFDQSAY